ncbi:MAG: cohesin domain-containing protein [Dehalococcoidia bacterium]
MRQPVRFLFPVAAAVFLGVLLAVLYAGDTPSALAAGPADVKLVSQVIGTPGGGCVNPAPTSIPINTNVTICTRITFHNNGPTTPVDVSISRTAQFIPQGGQPANECTITPASGLLTFNNVNASVTMTRDENYVINCNKPSSHKFRITNTLSVGPAGNTDPNTANNSATTDLDVGVTAEADFSIVSQELRDADCVSPAPTAIIANTNTVFCIVKTVHNNGPYGPTAADIFFESQAGAGCTIVPFVDSNGAQLQVSVNYTLSEFYTVNCTQASFHSFTIENFMEPTDPHVTDPNGVSYMATTHTVAVIGQADIKITSQTATAPPSAQPNQPFTVTVNKTIHNNGPYGPVPINISAVVSAPADCTVVPDAGNPASATLAVSVAQNVTENFTVTCSDPSNHQISITNCLSTNEPHANDPTPGNDCQTSSVNVPISINADLKITAQTLTGPPSATAGQPFNLTVAKTVHNNGPYSPAPGEVVATVTAPADCTVTPDPGNPSSVSLPASAATPLNETFSVTCTGASFHEFTIENCLNPSNVHVIDNDLSNNCETDTVTLPVFGQADVKITAQEVVDPPPPPIDRVAIDMDINNDITNLPKVIGTTEACGEVAVGGTIDVDVIVDAVPPFVSGSPGNGGIAGYDFNFDYNPARTKVVSYNPVMLLGANGGTIPIDFSETVPDTDGSFHLAFGDFGNQPPESGVGVVVRITLEGVSAGNSNLTMSSLLLVDGGNNGYTVNNNDGAELRVAGTCPPPITPSPTPSPSPSPSPTQDPGDPPDLIFDVGEEFGLKLIKTMHNNGPFGPTDVSITSTYTAPPDCTVMVSPLNPTSATLPVSTSVVITETFQTSCSQPSEHTFTFTNCIATTDPHVTDPVLTNNCRDSEITVVIVAQADLKVVSQSATAPASAPIGQPFTVTVDKTVHNNGPLSPALAAVNANVSAPADCVVVANPSNPSSVSLESSIAQNLSEEFTVTCSDPSFHDITITNCLATTDEHMIDPDDSNNCKTTTKTVAITTTTDLKVTAQSFKAADCTSPPPTVLPPNTNMNVCLVTTVHNNGPYTPVDATATITATAPPGCTAAPSPVNVAVNGMQASVAQTFNQVFTLNCTTGGMHNFQFQTDLHPNNTHIVDPSLPNNQPVITLPLVSDEADPKITSVVVNCPPTATTGTPFNCQVDVTVHNNGPSSPVSVDVVTELIPPFDCTLAPPGTQTQSRNLVASTSQVISYTWQATCAEHSFHMFTANSDLTMTSPGVVETNPNNNDGTGQDTTTVTAGVDVKVTAVAGIAPASVPANTPFNVQVDVSIHNNGPVSPVKIEGGAGIAVPGDCTIAPANFQLFNVMTLAASTTIIVSETFVVSCSLPGAHQIVVCGRAGPNTLHVAEVSTYNNFKSTPINVDVDGDTPPRVPTVGCSILGDPPEVCGDGIDNDGDTEVDEEPDADLDGLSDCVDTDDDGDTFTDAIEAFVGTDPLNDCARGPFDSAWPPDFNNTRSINISDVLSLKPLFGSIDGDGVYQTRKDLTGDDRINISDVLLLKPYFGSSCT